MSPLPKKLIFMDFFSRIEFCVKFVKILCRKKISYTILQAPGSDVGVDQKLTIDLVWP